MIFICLISGVFLLVRRGSDMQCSRAGRCALLTYSLLNAALETRFRYRQIQLEEAISDVDAVLEVLEGDWRVQQLPLGVIRQVRRYQMIRVRNEEEFIDRVNSLALAIILFTQQTVHSSGDVS